MRRAVRLLAVLALLVGLDAAPPDMIVGIDNFRFAPAELAVPAGTTVTWVNHDDIPHTVIGIGEATPFRSQPLDTDDRFSHRFDHRGRFSYFCSLHAHMTGVVVVQ